MTESQLIFSLKVSSVLNGLAYVVALCVFAICVVSFFLREVPTHFIKFFDRACIVLATVVALSILVSAVRVIPALFDPFQRFAFWNRISGPYAWAFWLITIPACVAPQLFWWKRFRTPISACMISIVAANPLAFELFARLLGVLRRASQS
ncbi:MAG: hypothetical protein RLY20_3457 [Verrucomicrobiota bacterium]|jgi:molybdopterin-containing oxidoreductase family membrane subunit